MRTPRSVIEHIARESIPKRDAGAPHPSMREGGVAQLRSSIERVSSKVDRISRFIGGKVTHGLGVYATDPPTARVYVDSGTGFVNGENVSNPILRLVDIPLDQLNEPHVWHLVLLPNGSVKLADAASPSSLLLAKIVAPTEEARRVVDEAPQYAGQDPDAYIIRGNDLVLATGYVFDEDTRAEILQSLDHIDTSFLFGDIDLDEGRSISTADGSVHIDSAGISTSYDNGQECFRVDTQGLVIFNQQGEVTFAIRGDTVQDNGIFARKASDETITGSWTFSRGEYAPFTVLSGAAVVTNLDSDMLDGRHEQEFGALADDETITGDWTFTDTLDVKATGAGVDAVLSVVASGAGSDATIVAKGIAGGSRGYSALRLQSDEATDKEWRIYHNDGGDNTLTFGFGNIGAGSNYYLFGRTGILTLGAITIGANTLDTTEFGHLDGLNQSLAKADQVQFDKIGINTATVPIGGTAHVSTGLSLDNRFFEMGTSSIDAYPMLYLVPFGHDSIGLLFDSYHDGSNWESSDAGSNFLIYKGGDALTFYYDSGVAQGATVTWNTALSIDTNGYTSVTGRLGVNESSPSVGLHITGITTYRGLEITVLREAVNYAGLMIESTGGGATCLTQLNGDFQIWCKADAGNFAIGANKILAVSSSGYLRMEGTRQVQFNAATEYIASLAAGHLDLEAATSVDINSILELEASTSATGHITQAGTRLLHTYGTANFFAGIGAGNFTLTGDYNMVIGAEAGDALTSGHSNVFIGYRSGGACTEGLYNVGIGRVALASLTTGSYNIAIGMEAGDAIIGGSYNFCAGHGAGGAITSGDHNQCLGYHAGWQITTAGYNTCFGSGAGAALVAGHNNTIIGYNAGAGLTGTYSVAIGANALDAACTGWYNTAVGRQAGGKNTSGARNTYIGYSAGGNATTGWYNTAIGMSAGALHETGSNNTYLGYGSGLTNTAGVGCVFLGYSSGYYETGSNKLFIDNAARASEADGRVKSLVYGIFDAATANQVFRVNGILETLEGAKIGANGVTDYANFAANGKLTFLGTARVTKHIDVNVETIRAPAANPATKAIVGLFPVWQFSNTTTNYVNFSLHMPEDWASGTDFNLVVHWAPTTGAAGDVVWDFEWDSVAQEADEVISGAGVNITTTDSTQSLQDELLETSAMTIVAAGLAVGECIGFRLYRDTGDGADTYGAPVSLVHIIIRYTVDKLGT